MSETFFYNADISKGNFTILDNTCIRDRRLSLKAKGLHTYFMSLPRDWKLYKSELVNHFKDGIDSVNSAIKELVKFGYVEITEQKRTVSGKFSGKCFGFHAIPKVIGDSESRNGFPVTVKPLTDKPSTENPLLLNTNILITNKIKTELTNYENNKVSETVFVKKIRELFEGEYPFDLNFESSVLLFIKNNELNDDSLEDFLIYIFERTKLCNIKKSFEGLYRKLALSKSILIDFKKSVVPQKSEKELQPVAKLITCPICNIEFDEFKFYCPKCNLTFKAIEENNEIEIKIARALLKMNDEERDKLEMAMNKKLKSIGRLFFIKNEKEEFYREYGLIN